MILMMLYFDYNILWPAFIHMGHIVPSISVWLLFIEVDIAVSSSLSPMIFFFIKKI